MITKFNTSSSNVPTKSSGSNSGLISGLLILAAGAGAIWYFGFYKPKKDKEKQAQEQEQNQDA